MNLRLDIQRVVRVAQRVALSVALLGGLCLVSSECVEAAPPNLLPSVTATGTDEVPLLIEGVVLRLIDDSQATALAAGVVTEVLAREGDLVKQGDPLAQLDEAQERIAVETALAESRIARHAADDDVAVRYAEKSAEAARAERRRSEESVNRFAKSVSQSQLDVEALAIERAVLEAEKARHGQQGAVLEAERAEQRLAAAELLLTRRRIVAPLDGVVIEASIRTGEWIEPGQRAFRVVSTGRLKAEGYLETALANASLLGRRVRLLVNSDAPLSNEWAAEGRITFVSPETDPVTGQVRFSAVVANETGQLRPGMRCRLTILAGSTGSPPADAVGSRAP